MERNELTNTTVLLDTVLMVGQAILPAAAFQAALSPHVRIPTLDERRLKAGCSQDWLPHEEI